MPGTALEDRDASRSVAVPAGRQDGETQRNPRGAKQPSWALSLRLTILSILFILSNLPPPENPSDLGALDVLAREFS
jgi:hypothetical protein